MEKRVEMARNDYLVTIWKIDEELNMNRKTVR
jgi:hypothetical protein